jgi:transposase InsO family protein
LTWPKKNEADAAADTPSADTLAAPTEEPGLSAWEEEEHVKRLHDLCQPSAAPPANNRRGPGPQLQRRRREHELRSNVVALLDWTRLHRITLSQTAERLSLAPRTLRRWRLQHEASALPLGRPCLRAPRAERNAVIALLDELGPATGVPTLRACFPTLARAELEDLMRRYRRVWRKRHQQALHVLHWQVPGAVWAMDFSQATCRVDGQDRYLLAVRDLASGQQLLWWPTPAINTDETLAALRHLFAAHGAPLVLKTDNGSPFCADQTLEFLRQADVISLFSPPRMPRYNGAVEAGIGSLKTRTDQHASHHGRANHWTRDDLSAAQAQANTEARPHGPSGPSPENMWTTRRRLTAEERTLFRAAVERRRQQLQVQEGLPDNAAHARAQDRPAIRRALEELGYLLYSRRRLPLPIQKQKVANIR